MPCPRYLSLQGFLSWYSHDCCIYNICQGQRVSVCLTIFPVSMPPSTTHPYITEFYLNNLLSGYLSHNLYHKFFSKRARFLFWEHRIYYNYCSIQRLDCFLFCFVHLFVFHFVWFGARLPNIGVNGNLFNRQMRSLSCVWNTFLFS
jgi:hypothetical protein